MSDPKSRKAKKIEVKGNMSSVLIGRKIGEVIDGGVLGLGKIKFRITGASDKSGIPHRQDIEGPVKKHILLSEGPGFNPEREGERRKKLVRGNTIADDTYQVNAVLVEGNLEVTPNA
ncbi:MAG: 30S ribosomal protein S6e [Thaumarchaeota archaeon]|nr:30S ribosomal protein S6e [Nitrososphaerota archaeon]